MESPRALFVASVTCGSAAGLTDWAVVAMWMQAVRRYGHPHLDLRLVALSVLLTAVATGLVWRCWMVWRGGRRGR